MEPVVTITKHCPMCGEPNEITVSKSGYAKWQGGMYVQDAFPELTPGQREVLISGCHEVCFDDAFDDFDDEDML